MKHLFYINVLFDRLNHLFQAQIATTPEREP